MSNPFESGDEAKNKYLDKALHANDEAVSGSKFTDLMNKDSSIYQGMPKPVEEVKPEVPEIPTVDAEGYPIVSPIHTYKADLTGIISDDKLSMSRIAMMNSNQSKPTEEKKTPKDNSKIYLMTGIILVVLGISVVAIMSVLNKKAEVIEQSAQVKEKYLVFAEKKESYDVTKSTKSEIAGFIKDRSQRFREEDSILEIIPTKLNEADGLEYKTTLLEFLSKVNSRIPEELSRTLADKFVLGLYSKKGVTTPFLVMYTSSYDIAYPSLLNWEGLMQDDFNWFTNTANQKTGTTIDKLSFKDRIVANKDIRSFEDSAGKVALFYTFIDEHTVLFAKSSDTMRKIIDRIREAKFQ